MIRNLNAIARGLSNSKRVSSIAQAAATGFLVLLSAGLALGSGGEEKSSDEVVKELVWQAVNLALLLGVLFYFGRKPVTEFFASRRSGIQSELSQAADLLAEAEQRNSELQRRLVDLSSEVDGIKQSASRRAQEEADRILADARSTADRIRSDAKASIDQELRRAQSLLQQEAADLALEAATQKLKDQVGEADRDRLVDEFILRVEPGSSASGEGANR